jgi:putative transposase
MNSTKKLLELQPGANVWFRDRRHIIKHIISLNELLLVDAETKAIIHATLCDVKSSPESESSGNRPDLAQITDARWTEALHRFEIIGPLIDKGKRSRQDVADRAKLYRLHENTLYDWLRRYEDTGLVTSLLPRERSDKGKTKLTSEVEAIIQAVIESEFLTKQRRSPAKACTEVRARCLKANICPPHDNTVRYRIKCLAGEHLVAKRMGRKASSQKYAPLQGSFPGADWPFAVVQIDHTPLDIILVDDLHRLPVGRPWVTLAIDVFSRMVAGFYVSFDPPGALSTGLCLANAILPKEKWLAKHDIKGEWPCWGIPSKLHMDNAREFRGNMLQRACHEYGMDIEWRPVARPNFGGHIERLLGSFSKEIHALPGTTFSNAREKGNYDSQAMAAMTLTEFEEWFVTLIVNVYHQRLHDGIKMPPIDKFRLGIFGDSLNPGRGLPARIADENRLLLDLMPYEERTVQNYGVAIDEVHYYHDVLRRWIDAPDPLSPKRKRKFTFRRDPRDISTIWFYDPELNAYYPIPYRNTSLPPISIWELREAKRRLETDGRKNIDERSIFEAYDRMREIEQQAQGKTVSVRRAAQRRKLGQHSARPTEKPDLSQVAPNPFAAQGCPLIEPFEEMDDLA